MVVVVVAVVVVIVVFVTATKYVVDVTCVSGESKI